ncbi:MAG: UTP--glucose-1-phosphate uridylyltransferase [Phycisphaerae bacterium]
MTEISDIRRKLETYDQEHLLQFWDQLDEPSRQKLRQQIQDIDFEHLDERMKQYVHQRPQLHLDTSELQPPEVTGAKPADDAQQARFDQARRRGLELLAEGKVAAFVVAGGQGTRLGYEGPKGCFEATPVMKKSLFQVFAEQILAASRRSGKPIPWYVMTSPANDVATRAFFRQNEFFGLDSDDVFFLVQGTMPAIGYDGRLLLAEKDKLALSPDGHGGSLLALKRSGALDDMKQRGIEQISYFQVDNPLVHCIDPLFIGLHEMAGAEMSAKALPKRDPMEKLGNFCVIDGRVHVIEYSDMPDELAEQTTDDGRLRFSAGSIAIHLIAVSFLDRLTKTGRLDLPFHRAEKKVPCVDRQGQRIEPQEPNAVKLEMFVFDAMPKAEETVILETRRAEEFSPIKNAEGPDSPATSLHDQIRRAAEWLEAAGVQVPRDADGQIAAAIEISPLLADSAAELAEKIDPEKVHIVSGKTLYLEPED